MPLDEEEMGSGAVRCLITKSTGLLIGHTSTNFSVQPRAIGEKTRVPHPQNPLGASMPTLVHPPLHYLGALVIPRLLHLHI